MNTKPKDQNQRQIKSGTPQVVQQFIIGHIESEQHDDDGQDAKGQKQITKFILQNNIQFNASKITLIMYTMIQE